MPGQACKIAPPSDTYGFFNSLSGISSMNTHRSSSALFQQLLGDEWEFRMREDPLFATLCGDHRYDDRLPGLAEADFERRLDRMLEFRRRRIGIDRNALPPSELLNYDVFTEYLDREIAELRFHAYRMPISKIDGYHALVPQMPQFIPLETSVDYENYIARMRAFPRMADDLIDVMRAGLRG